MTGLLGRVLARRIGLRFRVGVSFVGVVELVQIPGLLGKVLARRRGNLFRLVVRLRFGDKDVNTFLGDKGFCRFKSFGMMILYLLCCLFVWQSVYLLILLTNSS